MKKAMTLYYFPRACSLAPHIVIEESGYSYQRVLVDLRTASNKCLDYLSLNPLGTIPALSVGDWVLTETHSILTYLGDTAPNGPMLPAIGDPNRYRAHQWMNFLSSSIHTYIRSIFRPSAYVPEDDLSALAAVRETGRSNLERAVKSLESRLTGSDWTLGDTYSVVDAYMFIMYLWSDDDRIGITLDRPKWTAVAKRVWQRSAVKHIVALEQKDRDFVIPF
ncbi:MAG: glutathione S-transferase family protein [Rhodospirillales bacterium]|tara:strand:+ start:3882 stop:4544 length:663 start_codon:yes stop_codon:yes gene_type:complete